MSNQYSGLNELLAADRHAGRVFNRLPSDIQNALWQRESSICSFEILCAVAKELAARSVRAKKRQRE